MENNLHINCESRDAAMAAAAKNILLHLSGMVIFSNARLSADLSTIEKFIENTDGARFDLRTEEALRTLSLRAGPVGLTG